MSSKRWAAVAAIAAALIAVAVIRPGCGDEPAGGDAAAPAPAFPAAELRAQIERIRAGRVPAIPAASYGDLRGIVVDPDGAPVPDAAVRLLARPTGAPPPEGATEVTTDSDGAFAFEHQLVGAYVLEAQRDAAVSPTVRYRLTRSSERARLVVYPGAVLRVEVVRAGDHEPIAGATVGVAAGEVEFGDLGHWRRATTGADGVAELRGLVPTSNHAVYAEADGYVDGFANLLQGAFADREGWHARLELEPGALLSGRVVDARGAPVAGATVGFDPSRNEPHGIGLYSPFIQGGAVHTSTTDDDGRYRHSGPAGVGCLVATHPGYQMTERCDVEAVVGSERSGIDLVLRDGATIAGTVVDADGNAAPEATVLITMRGVELMPRFYDKLRFRTRSDDRGRFVLTGLDRLPVVVYAHRDDASSDLVDVDLTTQSEQTGVVVALVHAHSLAGVVVEEDLSPVADATVLFTPNSLVGADGFEDEERIRQRGVDESPPRWTMTRTQGAVRADAQGRFRITGLPEGAYNVEARRPTLPSVPANFATEAVRGVFTGDEVTIVMPPMGGVRGRVVGSDGQPPEVFTVSLAIGRGRLEERSYPAGRAFGGGDGTFEIGDVPARSYSARVVGPGYEPWYADAPIEVEGGKVVDLGTIQLRRGIRREGVVVDPAGAPVEDAKVLIATPQRSQSELSNHDGEFEMPTLASDVPVKVRATTETGSSPWVEVGPTQKRVEVVISEAALGVIEGVVVDPGEEIDGRLVAIAPPEAGSPNESPPIKTANAGAGGKFRVPDLVVGEYRVWIRRAIDELDLLDDEAAPEEWYGHPQVIDLRPNETRTVMIDMSEEP